MARSTGNMSEKTKEQRIQEREEALRGALPQRLAFQKLFGSQFILPEDRTRRAPRPGTMARNQGTARQMSFGMRLLPSGA